VFGPGGEVLNGGAAGPHNFQTGQTERGVGGHGGAVGGGGGVL